MDNMEFNSEEIANLTSKLNDLLESIKSPSENEMATLLSIGQFKSLLYSKDKAIRLNNQNRWTQVEENVREQFKILFIDMIKTETTNSSHSAQCLALIACAEISKGLWPDCFNVLINLLNDAELSQNTKASIFQTIGFIFKQLYLNVQSVDLGKILNYNIINELFGLILNCLKSEDINQTVKLAAANIVFDSYELSKYYHSEDDNVRLSLKIINESLNNDSKDKLKIAALKYMDKVINNQYDSLIFKEQMETYLIDKTLSIIENSNDDDLVFYAIYLWICITKIELKYQNDKKSTDVEYQHHMFTTFDLDRLISVLLRHLCKEKENEPDGEWNPFKGSAVCLMLLSTCLEQEILPHLIPFINNNIMSEEWQFREAALIAFGSLLVDFANAEPLMKKLFHFDDKIKIVKDLLENDPNETIRHTALCLANRVCERFPENKNEFDSVSLHEKPIDHNSFKYLLFKNDFNDFSEFKSKDAKKSSRLAKNDLSKLPTIETNAEKSNTPNDPANTTEEELEDKNQNKENALFTTKSIINLDDIKNAITKLRKVSLNQEITDIIVSNNGDKNNNDLSNQTIQEEEFLIATNPNPNNELVNQVFVYEKSQQQQEINTAINEIDDILEKNSSQNDSTPILTSTSEISTEIKSEQELTKEIVQSENLEQKPVKGTVASITAVLVENLNLPAHELQEKNRKKNFKIIPTPEVNTPEFFKIKLKHVGNNLN